MGLINKLDKDLGIKKYSQLSRTNTRAAQPPTRRPKPLCPCSEFPMAGTTHNTKFMQCGGSVLYLGFGFIISFSNVGQFGAGRAKHFAALNFLALLIPALHKLQRWAQALLDKLDK